MACRVVFTAVVSAAVVGGAAVRLAEAGRADGDVETKADSGSAAAIDDREIIARIDELVGEQLAAHDVRPAPPATDAEWVRRLYLDLVGRIPTVEELDAFAALPRSSARRTLVDRLLGREYEDEYARYWANVWANTLIGRTGGREPNSPTSRSGLLSYLGDSLRANKPYDRMTAELLTATGDAQPSGEQFNGAVNFLIGKLDDNAVQAAAKTAQVFLGMSVQCTQCHNHPFNEYRQNQFWELDAFFRQARVERDSMGGGRSRAARLVDVDFGGEGRMAGVDSRREIFLEMQDGKLVDRDLASSRAAPIFYELRNGQVQAAYPAFVDGTTLASRLADRGPEFGNSGLLSDVRRREELAKLVLAAPELEQAAVNRMWARLLGYGFTRPVDDMGPHNPPSHPQLLAELAKAYRASGFDSKRLLRWIVLSRTYGASSRMESGGAADDPTKGTPPLFSRFYLRSMEPEQLYASLMAATEADAGLRDFDRDLMQSQWLAQFTTSAGNDEGGESTTFDGTISQALMMMNGELVRRACRTDGGGLLDRVARDESSSNREKFRTLYRAALGRQPGGDETGVCNELLAARGGDVPQTLQDVWWALLNSNEFILVH
jgi:hypothetical protein